MSETNKQVRVGVGVALYSPNGLVLMKRRGSHGSGDWNFPGGHLEFGESVEDCAHREVLEELGVTMHECRKIKFFTEDYFPGKQYITLYCIGKTDQTPSIQEPEKASELAFINTEWLPSPLFSGVQDVIDLIAAELI